MLQFYFSQKLDWTHESLCKDMPLQVGNFYLVLKLLYNIVKLCGQNCDIVQFQQHLLVTSGRKFI